VGADADESVHLIARSLPEFAADPLRLLDNAGLRDLIARLRRVTQDLLERKEVRAAMLETPPGAPQSDPVYQRLFFAHQGLLLDMDRAERELSRRTDTSRPCAALHWLGEWRAARKSRCARRARAAPA
jgi:hypothetical protein